MKVFGRAAAFGIALVVSAPVFAADKTAIPLSTPPGITLVDVVKTMGNASDSYLWRRLGDASGRPLYTSNQDAGALKPTCTGECAKEFTPFVAPAGAMVFGDWSVVTRDDGVKQWAYQRQPLYYYAGGVDPKGEPANNGALSTMGAENPEFMDSGSKIFSPKQGWKRAAYTPGNTFSTPSGIDLQSLPTANGYGLVDSMTKRMTYIMKTPPKNPTLWQPMYAPAMAVPMGDFTILAREDGTKQWAYKEQRLYTFNGDYSSSDKNGTVEERDAQVALVYRHFAPDSVGINVYVGRGPLMVTKAGLSLYTQSRQQLQYGGRESRDGYRYGYSSAKAVGTRGCMDDCTKTWHPLVAPPGAQSSGFWEVATRNDGVKQWAYKGSPLYTFDEDKKPGDIEGNNRHIIIYGDPTGKTDLSVTGGDVLEGRNSTGSGLYWHLAGLFY